jgi:predicted P-loop ATPase
MTATITFNSIPDPLGLPDLTLNSHDKLATVQVITADNVRYVLKATDFTVRLNMMTGGVELSHPQVAETSQQAQEYMEMMVLDMCTRMRMKGRDTIREIINVIGKENPYHPMEDWLQSLPQDDIDHIGDLTDTVTTDNALWPVYLRKWLIQCVQGVCGWRDPVPAPLQHVLVLVGAQGVGKSYWLQSVGGRWMKGEAELHLNTSSGKDHQIEALRRPMAELSELDGIFRKADIENMKSFISRTEDAIRAPYDRRALIRPRMTSFCGSVNNSEFLTDPTGARRFWPVEVEAIDWGAKVSWEGVWAQAYEAWLDGEAFVLSAEEDRDRARVTLDAHTVACPEAEAVLDFYARHAHLTHTLQPMTVSEILAMLGYGDAVWVKTRSEVSQALRGELGKHRTLPRKGAGLPAKKRAWPFPFSAVARDRDTWCREIPFNLIDGGRPESQ